MQILLLGDSDIARWPTELLPEYTPTLVSDPSSNRKDVVQKGKKNCNNNQERARVQVRGYSGATLEQVVDHFDVSCALNDADAAENANDAENATTATPTIVVFCAGENDIGDGIPLQTTLRALDMLFEKMELLSSQSKSSSSSSSSSSCHVANDYPCKPNHHHHHHHLIVLGPKLEPWLNDDVKSRKQYMRLSKGMQRRCLKRQQSYTTTTTTTATTTMTTTFCDCLFMFCNDGGDSDEACRADSKFFHKDQLHLNECGYRIWKEMVEEELRKWSNAKTSVIID